MPADETQLRRLATEVAAVLQRAAPSACLLAGGSLAAGRADPHSDLDLYVITEHALPHAVRRERLRTLADPRSLPFWDQPVRTGGLADTCRVAGRDMTICYRRAAEVEQAVADLLAGRRSEPSFEAAYGHELSTAEILADPHGLAAGWQRRLRDYPAARGRQLAAELAARLAAASLRSDQATALLAPAVAWSIHRVCAAQALWYPGCKRRPATAGWPAAARAELAAVEAVLREPGSGADRLARLGAWGDSGATPHEAAVAAALRLPELPREQWVNLGCDALGGRLEVALDRADPFAATHYLGRAIEAMTALGCDPGPAALAGSPIDARRRLAGQWSPWLTARGWLNSYAEAALRLALA